MIELFKIQSFSFFSNLYFSFLFWSCSLFLDLDAWDAFVFQDGKKFKREGNFSPRYVKWRNMIYKRFNYKCYKCNDNKQITIVVTYQSFLPSQKERRK
jgi:hypothetical protein